MPPIGSSHKSFVGKGYGIFGMHRAVVGEWAILAEGAVVRQRQQIPDERIAVGTPAELLEKVVSAEYKQKWTAFKRVYVDLARRYPQELR